MATTLPPHNQSLFALGYECSPMRPPGATMLPMADTYWMTAAQVIEIGTGIKAYPTET